MTPTGGEVIINGENPNANRKNYVKNIGAMFGQKTQLWWDLPLEDSYLLLKDMFDVDDATYKQNMELFSDVLEIDKFIHQPVRQLSLGQRVRGDLAAVLLHNPRVVFLDEPTLGLDFVVKKKIREFLREVNQLHHTTVMLTSHDIADIESVCERVIIINSGKIAYTGTLDRLRGSYGKTRKLDITFSGEYEDFEIGGAKLISSDGNKKLYSFSDDVSPSHLINEASHAHEIANIAIIEPDIEDIIGEIYRSEAGEVR
jgi:ABC-2 type transport system ATP-binding protein